MGLLTLLGLGIILYLIFRSRSNVNSTEQVNDIDAQLQDRNVEWAQFIANYYDAAKTKPEKQLIEKMLADIAAKGLPAPVVGSTKTIPAAITNPIIESAEAESPEVNEENQTKLRASGAQKEIDNASLLLYFGAFLFVTSVGLFIAFGGLPGTLRALSVAFVAASMYASGIWLFRNRPKLEQAGLAFAGIGLATAPFVGLAAYNFIFDQSAGPFVWFMTSIACLGLYAHALVVLKKPLLNYVLLFTMLSLIESGVSIIEAPIYYFGWAMALAGILFAFISRYKGVNSELSNASSQSAQLFVPLSALASLFLIESQGTMQLGVSLLLASLYYLTEAFYGRVADRLATAAAAQILGTVGVATLTYSIWEHFAAVSISLVLISVAVVMATVLFGKLNQLWENAASISVGVGLASIVAGLQTPSVLTFAVAVTCIQAVAFWLLQKRDDAYMVGLTLWTALPLVIGQLLLEPSLSAQNQTLLLLGSLLLQWALIFAWRKRASETWQSSAMALYILSCVVVIGVAAIGSSWLLMIICATVTLSITLLAEHDNLSEWTAYAGGFMLIPIAFHDSEGWFLASTAVALVTNIAIALRYRQDFSRWVGTGLWLLLPVALGQNVSNWSTDHYVLAYGAVLAVLIFSRAIARGMLLSSTKVPVASYARSASYSYVVGYVSAAFVMLMASLNSSEPQLMTTGVLVALIGASWLLAAKIEKQPDIYIMIPLLLQAVLLSALRPTFDTVDVNTFLALSTIVAGTGYVLSVLPKEGEKTISQASIALREGSLASAVITPLSVLVVGKTELLMPVGLAVFTVLLYHRLREVQQSGRELLGGLGLLAVWWLMSYMGVTNYQAYTHVLAALFAGYAYWRFTRKDKAGSDQYLYAMLGTATIPLVLQALSGSAGGLYGWWLLLEQVGFMLLGMVIARPFVTKWGLYVSVGAVLYQLRGLGWAALAILALFLIALAVYRLQKQEEKK